MDETELQTIEDAIAAPLRLVAEVRRLKRELATTRTAYDTLADTIRKADAAIGPLGAAVRRFQHCEVMPSAFAGGPPPKQGDPEELAFLRAYCDLARERFRHLEQLANDAMAGCAYRSPLF